MSRKPGQKLTEERRIIFTPDTDLWEQIEHFRMLEDCSRPDAVKALCRMALAATPMAGLNEARARRSYNEIRAWALNHVFKAFREMDQLLESTLRNQTGE